MKFEIDIHEDIIKQGNLEPWLEAVENKLKVRFPEDYRRHMLEYNGGSAIGENVIFDSYKANVSVGEHIQPKRFYYLDDGNGSLEKEAKGDGIDYIPKGIAICGTYSGILMMSLAQSNFGSIYHMHSYGEPVKIANSWTEFVSYLIDYDEDA